MTPRTIVKHYTDSEGNWHTEVLDYETGEVISDTKDSDGEDPDEAWDKEHGL